MLLSVAEHKKEQDALARRLGKLGERIFVLETKLIQQHANFNPRIEKLEHRVVSRCNTITACACGKRNCDCE